MKLLSKLFPINLYLNIFQLEGYDIPRFIKWVMRNFLVKEIPEKRKLIFTAKAKLLLSLSSIQILTIFCIFLVFNTSIILSAALAILVSTQFYLFLIIARIILYPFELLITELLVVKTRNKINSFESLKIIGITGSYGKTVTKEIIYQLIKDKFKTLRTPESYNTILGIAKVIDYELDSSYRYFICEMAAYHKGDIKKLCQMVEPNYGILTGITSQHLERFGSFTNITKTKFELYDFIQNKNNIVFNLNDRSITDEVIKRKIKKPQGYLKASNLIFSNRGSKFKFIYKNKKYSVKTNLFGISNIENLTGAISISLKLGMDIDYLIERTKTLVPVQSRFIVRNFGKTAIVDNTFSSNEQAFRQTIETARLLTGKKVLVTPGIVELGKEEKRINGLLGSEANGVFDKVVLVGNNNRTISFSKNYKGPFEFINDTKANYFEKIEVLKSKFNWIFLENDVTQNY